MKNLININNLTFRYKDEFIFDRFNLSIKSGEWISITGPNGSGKSTLIKIITGLLETDCDISICDLKLNKDNLFNIRKEIGIVFDNPENLFLSETVEDDLIFPLENLCYEKSEIKSRLKEISNDLNITKYLKKSPNELSGGEKAKVALACALIHKPRILILDESLSMIDDKDKLSILSYLKNANEKGLTIISIVHDLKETYFSNRLLIINDGQIILDGPPLKVMEYDKVLNRLGIEIPFEIDLSIKLKLYGLIDTIVPNIEKLVDILWE